MSSQRQEFDGCGPLLQLDRWGPGGASAGPPGVEAQYSTVHGHGGRRMPRFGSLSYDVVSAFLGSLLSVETVKP